MVLKRLLISDMGKSARRQNSSCWYDSWLFISNTGKDCATYSLLTSSGRYSICQEAELYMSLQLYEKNYLTQTVHCDIEEASACSFRSPQRQSIWWDTELCELYPISSVILRKPPYICSSLLGDRASAQRQLYESAELYLNGGFEKAVCWWPWGRNCSLLSLQGDRPHHTYFYAFIYVYAYVHTDL